MFIVFIVFIVFITRHATRKVRFGIVRYEARVNALRASSS